MKVAIALILILSLALLVGCDQAPPPDNSLEGIKAELSALPRRYTQAKAVRDGCVVTKAGELIAGGEIVNKFIEDCEQGIPTTMTSVYYWDGVIGITKVVYDGEKFYGVEDLTRDQPKSYRTFEYQYLKVFTGKGIYRLILFDDDSITEGDYLMSIFSSHSDAWIPHQLILWYGR